MCVCAGFIQVALELLAFAAPSHEVDQLRQVFVSIDTDGSGSISRDEFRSAMAAHPQFQEAELRNCRRRRLHSSTSTSGGLSRACLLLLVWRVLLC